MTKPNSSSKTPSRYQLLTDELVEQIDKSSPEDQADWLMLVESQEFPGYWEVEGLDTEFFYDFEDLLGRYRLVSPVRINAVLSKAEELNYKVAFIEDPTHILKEYEALKEPPPVTLNSSMKNTVNGFLPWQVVGFNKLIKSDIPAGIAVWITGSGKTALIAGSIKWRMEREDVDLAVVMVKAHNKYEMQRKLKELGDIDSFVIESTPEAKRIQTYIQVEDRLEAKLPTVVIGNYEKLRDEATIWQALVNKRRCLFFWDEMPTKLSGGGTQLYEATKRTLYEVFISKPRPAWMRHLVLSATPIESDPDGLYSYVNLVHPWLLGTRTKFHEQHVTRRNWISGKPERWADLDKVEAQMDHMMTRVSKDDPEVAEMFPENLQVPMLIDWNPKHRNIYDRFLNASKDILKEEGSGINILSMIQICQMLCDAPSMVAASAQNREAFSALVAAQEDPDDLDFPWSGPRGSEAALRLLEMVQGNLSDAGHTKLDTMREIIMEKHPEDKVVVHSTWANYIFPVWEEALTSWGIPYVIYAGTDRQKQQALDDFRTDPDIRVFLSGDSGSDSIDIPEARVGISYNGSWGWHTMVQREGRRDRVNSKFPFIYSYTLAMADSVEDRKREIREQKKAYHDAIFEGRAVEGSLSAKLTIDDLLYILRGEDVDS